MNNKVLLLSYIFPPIAGADAYISAKLISNLPNFKADVISAIPSEAQCSEEPSLNYYVKSRFQNITRVRFTFWGKRILPRIVNRLPYLANIPDIFLYMNKNVLKEVFKRNISDYKAIITWSQWHSVHLAGLRIKKKVLNIPWIAYFGDPWADNPFSKHTHLIKATNFFLERMVVRTADRIIFPSQEMAGLVMAKYPTEWNSKVRVVPCSFEPELYSPANLVNDSSRLTIRYLGQFYGPRIPRPLFRALRQLLASHASFLDDVCFEFIGHNHPSIFKLSGLDDLPKGLVSVKPPVPYRESLSLMTSADGLLVIDAPAETSVFLPSKLVDYVGAGRPILGLTPKGAAAVLINKLGGWVADPEDETAMAGTIRCFISYLRENKSNNKSSWGNPMVRKNYEVSFVAKTFESILRELLGY